MQEKLNNTLQIHSPAEKKEKMRKQSKKNLEVKQQKLVKAIQKKKQMKEVEKRDLEEVLINTKTVAIKIALTTKVSKSSHAKVKSTQSKVKSDTNTKKKNTKKVIKNVLKKAFFNACCCI